MKLKVKLVRSKNGAHPKNRSTIAALGLRKIGQEVIHEDTQAIRGMLYKVKQFVDVRPVETSDAS